MAAASKTLDLVVWGSTGFTGKYIARHLAEAYLPLPAPPSSSTSSPPASPPAPPLRWALAGRSLPKLEALRLELAKINPAAAAVPLLVASLDDAASLDAAVGSARAVISAAGPYAAIGSEVVASAVRCGTHYADLTAEIPWVLSMHDRHSRDAIANGVKVVHSAGFDSQPSDLSAFLLAGEARRRHGVGLREIWTLAGPAKGGFSGGTVESLLTACYENRGGEESRRRAAGLHCLAEASGAGGGAGASSASAPPPPPPPSASSSVPRGLRPRFVEPAGTWTAPFVMAFINERVVRRSAALLPRLYGEGAPPRVTEGLAVPNAVAAALVSSIMALGSLLCGLRPFRALVRAAAPKQGSGPSDELCRSGSWRMDAVGVTLPDVSGRSHIVRAVAEDPKRDPGYWGTSRMLVEIGVALATQSQELEEAGCLRGGFLTPATAGGSVLVERLNRAGMRFEVVEEDAEKK
jgi:short subunit dehydrogenase-like uncharacterized protein